MGWIVYAIVVLGISVFVGRHLGRFREAYTEMTGMMAGMTMGMMNGFVLGFAAAAASTAVFHATATLSLFWGNLVGIGLGLALGAYFGRAGGLMGVMDGGMGGVMGGSMGAMLAAMLTFPEELMLWTIIPLSALYIASMTGLVVLIERSAPGHAALHRLAPYFTRSIAEEIAEEAGARKAAASVQRPQIEDYYALLEVTPDAGSDLITGAYLEKLSGASADSVQKIERAFAILTDPTKRRLYDEKLAQSGRADCCPPPKAKKVAVAPAAAVAQNLVLANASATAPAQRNVTASVSSRPAESVPVKQREPLGKGNQPARNGSTPRQGGSKQQVVAQVGTRRVQTRDRRNQRRGGGPGPLIGGGIAVLVLLGVLGSWMVGQSLSAPAQPSAGAGANQQQPVAKTDSGSELSADFVNKLQSEAAVAPLGSNGTQTLDLIINGDARSYRPNVIKVKQGVPVHFNLTVEGQDPG